jgi:competence protein ComEC
VRLISLGVLIGAFALQSLPALPLADVRFWTIGAAIAVALGATAHLRAQGLRRIGGVLLVIATAAAGFGYAQWRAESRLADSLAPEWEGRDIEVVGVVASLPTVNERGTRFEFDVERVVTEGAHVPAHISLNWYAEQARKGFEEQPPPLLKPGERWQLTVRLRRPHGTANPHGYDFEAFALERNIRATGYVRFRGDNSKRADFVAGFGYRVDRLRLVIRDRMNAALRDMPYRGVLIALAIGEQGAIPADQWRSFWRTGVGHLISISGLHITMMASFAYWFAFRFWARVPALVLRIPAQRAAVIAGACMALVYSLVAGFSVPTQRTLFMLATVAVAMWVGRTSSASRILAIALVSVILLDPWAVLAPGFWLSFGAVAAIFFVTVHRTGKLSAVRGAFLTQLAVTLGLLPMTLALFQEVSIVSPIANAFAIPLVSLVVVPLTLLGAVLPFDAVLWFAHEIMAWCYAALNWLATLPNAVWQSHAPQAWTVALALLGCAWLLLPRGSVPRALGFVFMLPMFLVFPPSPKPGELWVTLLDVGQGLSTVVRTANHVMVYDTGPRYNPDSDSGNRIVVPYLRGEGLRQLDALVVTHDDEDHTGGAQSIIAARNPKWVLTSADSDRDIFAGAQDVLRCVAHDVRNAWDWDGVRLEVLHPTVEDYAEDSRKTNNLGCTIKITAAGGTVLMTADIERKSEEEILARDPAALKADVLVVPHHGSKTSSSDAFLDAVAPKVALLPVGYRNRFRHPHPDVMARYAERKIRALRTDELGAITMKFGVEPKSLPEVTSYRQTHKRYWTDTPSQSAALE